jgi:hypothetical protein
MDHSEYVVEKVIFEEITAVLQKSSRLAKYVSSLPIQINAQLDISW